MTRGERERESYKIVKPIKLPSNVVIARCVPTGCKRTYNVRNTRRGSRGGAERALAPPPPPQKKKKKKKKRRKEKKGKGKRRERERKKRKKKRKGERRIPGDRKGLASQAVEPPPPPPPQSKKIREKEGKGKKKVKEEILAY